MGSRLVDEVDFRVVKRETHTTREKGGHCLIAGAEESESGNYDKG